MGIAFNMKEFFNRQTFVSLLLGHPSNRVTALHGMTWTLMFTEMIRGPNPVSPHSSSEQALAAGGGGGPEVPPGTAE